MESKCCGKNPEAIEWNPYNKVVQCHHCGHVYVPKVYSKPFERK